MKVVRRKLMILPIHKALEQFPPNKRIVVISDNIEAAKKAIKLDCEYQTNSLILQLPTGWQVEQTILFSQLLNQLN